MPQVVELIVKMLKDILLFSKHGSGVTLRNYQEAVAMAVAESVIKREGRSFVVMFPRQSGKNELQAEIEAYLLTLFSTLQGEIVKVSPTWKPQSLNAMRRLERILRKNLITRNLWEKEEGYVYRVGDARIYFLSGSGKANIVGATASTLLEVDEAQDVLPAKFDKDISPMAASTNATRVFWGTAWTSQTLLARELRAARAAEEKDGKRRVFVLTADQVAAEVPAYGQFVADQVAKLGRNHPMVKTQFYSEEIDGESGMFPLTRRALMQGAHAFNLYPEAGKIYAFLLDVAGEDAGNGSGDGGLENPDRDSTALTVVEVDLSSLADEDIKAPIYRVICRHQWIGDKQTSLYAKVRVQVSIWNPRYLVIDATGIGAGLASFLDKSMPGRVLPFVFNSSTKSKLGWDFLSVIETGRFLDGRLETAARFTPAARDGRSVSMPSPQVSLEQIQLKVLFDQQLEHCNLEILPGPAKNIKWGVANGLRDVLTGDVIHDDLVLSAALCAVLDGQEWHFVGESAIIQVRDVMLDLDKRGGW